MKRFKLLQTPVALAALAALLTQFAALSASATTYYWDTDGATAGFGNNAGTWGMDAFWSTSSAGSSTTFTTTTTNDLVNFSTSTLALGSTAASVAVSGTVDVGRITFGAAQPSGTPVVLTGGTINLGGTNAAPHIAPNSVLATINSAISLNSNVQINGPSGGSGGTVMTLNLNGTISGGFNVTFFGPSGNNNYSTIVLGAPSRYSGTTLLNCTGTGANLFMKLGIDDALPTATVLTLDGQAGAGSGRSVQLDLNGYNQTLAGLTTVTRTSLRFQRIINGGATASTLTVTNASNYTFGGQIGTPAAGNIRLTKDGAGTLTLNPVNTGAGSVLQNLAYTNDTRINNGILEIANNGQLGNGNYAANVSIAGGATLLFSGTRTNTLSGTLSGPGSLTNSGSGMVTISGTDALASTVVANGYGAIAITGAAAVSSLEVGDGCTLNLPGTGAATVTNLTFDNTGTMNFNVAKGGALLCPVANGITNNGAAGSIVINITGSVPASGTYTLISCAGSLQGSGASAYTLGSTPAGSYLLTTTAGAVQLTVVSPVLSWTGASSPEWSQNLIPLPKNWTLTNSPIDYVDGEFVLFDDTTTSNLVNVSVADVMPSDVTFNNTTNAYTLQGTSAIAGGTSLTKNGTNTLTVLNNNSYYGNTLINAGVVQVGNGGASGALGYGDINNYGALEFNRSDDLVLYQNINGTGTLTKKGTNTLTIATASTYTGNTTVSSGTLVMSGSVLSSGARNYSIAAGAVLDLDNGGPALGTSVISGSGTLLITGQVVNNLGVQHFFNISLSPSALIRIPYGATMVNGNNTSLLWASNLAPMNLDGMLDVNSGNGVFVDALTGSGTIDTLFPNSGNFFAVNVTVGVAGGSGTFSGAILNTSTHVTVSLTKAGAGAQTFTGALAHKGATTVSAGTLLLSGAGSIDNSTTINILTNATLDVTGRTDGALTLNANQTLMGDGTVLGVVTNNGKLAPGASIGTLTISGNLVLGDTSTSTFEVDGSTPTNDVVVLGASVTYGGVLKILPSGSFTPGQTFTLFRGAGAASASNFASITGSPGAGRAFTFTNGVLSVVSTGPTLTSIAPNPVPGSTYPVTLGLTGSGFTGATAVLLTNLTTAGGASSVPTINSDTSLSVSFVPGTAASSWTATVVNGAPSAPLGFTVSAPSALSINGSSVSSAGPGKVVLSGSGGEPSYSYAVLSATNLIPPVVWTPVVTNAFDSSGNFSYTNTVDPATPKLFLRLQR